MQSLWQDLRFAARTLARAPGFTIASLITLALGIGATTAIFSALNGILLRPMPFEGGDRLVHLVQPATRTDEEDVGFSPAEIGDLRTASRSVSGIVEYHSMPFNLLGRGEPLRVQTAVVSADYFDLLGVRPLLGRLLQDSDEDPAAPGALLLSYEFWQRQFGGDSTLVGPAFEMNDRVHTLRAT